MVEETWDPVDIVHLAVGNLLDKLDLLSYLAPQAVMVVDGDVPGGRGGIYTGSGAVTTALAAIVADPQQGGAMAAPSFTGYQVLAEVGEYRLWVNVEAGRITEIQLMTEDGFAVRSLFAAHKYALCIGDFSCVEDHFAGDFQYAGLQGAAARESFVHSLKKLIVAQQFSVEVLPGNHEHDVQAVVTTTEARITLFFDVHISGGIVAASYCA